MSFITSGFNIEAIVGEVLQKHIHLPLVQDPGFMPSSVRNFILLHPSSANS